MTKLRPQTEEELATMRAHARKHGHYWKARLRDDWMNARSPGTGDLRDIRQWRHRRGDQGWRKRAVDDFLSGRRAAGAYQAADFPSWVGLRHTHAPLNSVLRGRIVATIDDYITKLGPQSELEQDFADRARNYVTLFTRPPPN